MQCILNPRLSCDSVNLHKLTKNMVTCMSITLYEHSRILKVIYCSIIFFYSTIVSVWLVALLKRGSVEVLMIIVVVETTMVTIFSVE